MHQPVSGISFLLHVVAYDISHRNVLKTSATTTPHKLLHLATSDIIRSPTLLGTSDGRCYNCKTQST